MAENEQGDPTSEMVPLVGDVEFCCHFWNYGVAEKQQVKALVVVYHGFLAHGRFPTVRYAAECLAKEGYAVMSADFRGHGRTPSGLRGYVESPNDLVQDGVAMAQYAHKRLLLNLEGETNGDETNRKKIKLFLLGSSMGGTIALSVAQRLQLANNSNNIVVADGVILLAPMLKLKVNTLERYALRAAWTIGLGSWEILPNNATNSELQYRDPQKRKECDASSCNTSALRLGSAYSLVELCRGVRDEFGSINFPFLVMVAEQDSVVDPTGCTDLMERTTALSNDEKTIKRYPALHGLLCEPSPLIDTIRGDLLKWINEQTSM